MVKRPVTPKQSFQALIIFKKTQLLLSLYDNLNSH